MTEPMIAGFAAHVHPHMAIVGGTHSELDPPRVDADLGAFSPLPLVDERPLLRRLDIPLDGTIFDGWTLDEGRTYRQNTCRTFTIWRRNANGAPYKWRRPCGKWDCYATPEEKEERRDAPNCGGEKLHRYRLQLMDPTTPFFGEHETIHYLPTDPAEAKTFENRRDRARQELGGEWMYVPTTGGLRHYFTSWPIDLPGDPIESVALDIPTATQLLCDLLHPALVARKPATARMPRSPWWFIDEKHEDKGGGELGYCPPPIEHKVWDLFAERTEARFGFAYEVSTEWLPDELNTDAHHAVFKLMFAGCVETVSKAKAEAAAKAKAKKTPRLRAVS